MKILFTAKDAAEITKQNRLHTILSNVRDAARIGDDTTSWYGSDLTEEEAQSLRDAGYRLDGRCISWREGITDDSADPAELLSKKDALLVKWAAENANT